MSPEVFDLFPTPVMRVPRVLAEGEAAPLAQRLASRAEVANDRSMQLSHSAMLAPGDDDMLDALVPRLGPHVQALGQLLFGETLRWLVKEIWANVLQGGGQQAVHNHANAFVSGIVYLTPVEASSRTVFIRSLGGNEFSFRNTNERTAPTPYNAQKWIAPQPQTGDLLLFPSYLLHEVPAHAGQARVTLAFNAIPDRLDAWGYAVAFQP